jgi:hypothetical protein
MTKEGTYEKVTVELDPQAPAPVAASEDKPARKYTKRTPGALDQPEETPDF